MDIRTYALGPLQTNGYLLSEAGEAVFVDPGGDAGRVVKDIKAEGLRLTHILVTHFHCDHVYGCRQLADATGAAIMASPEGAGLLETEIGGGGFMGLPVVARFSWEPMEPGEYEFLGQPCHAFSTPGHAPGSLSFWFPEAGAVFAGDLLFKRSIGRTDFPGGDLDTLLESVREKIFTLPPQTVVYSGHGPETTVGDEMNHNPFFHM